MKKINLIVLSLISSLLLLSCSSNNNSTTGTTDTSRVFGIFQVLEDNVTIRMNGVIDTPALDDYTRLRVAFPNTNKINIVNCEGSFNDVINLQLSAKVYADMMNIHVNDDGLIASGGVDFFVAGRQRTKGTNARIAVHSWAGGGQTATDFPVGHTEHLKYINYYVSVGFTQKQAEDFYYFTINAAPANSLHYMTDEEIAKYNILTSSN